MIEKHMNYFNCRSKGPPKQKKPVFFLVKTRLLPVLVFRCSGSREGLMAFWKV